MSNFLNQDFGSEDEDDDFNPIAHADSDAEEKEAKVSDRSLMGLDELCTDSRGRHSRRKRNLTVPTMM